MSWIQPLELGTWFMNVFAGDPEVFAAIAIFIIICVSAMFRMTSIAMFFILGVFILMFSGFISQSFVVLFGIIGGLLIGYWISRLIK